MVWIPIILGLCWKQEDHSSSRPAWALKQLPDSKKAKIDKRREFYILLENQFNLNVLHTKSNFILKKLEGHPSTFRKCYFYPLKFKSTWPKITRADQEPNFTTEQGPHPVYQPPQIKGTYKLPLHIYRSSLRTKKTRTFSTFSFKFWDRVSLNCSG